MKSILLLQEDFVEFYCDEFAILCIDNLNKVLESKASFILLGVLEKGGRDHLVQTIMKANGLNLDKCIAGKHFYKLFETAKQNQVNSNGNSNDKKDKKKKNWFIDTFIYLIVYIVIFQVDKSLG